MFYLQRNYQKAIRYYEKALEFEKKVPQLDRDTKRVLIDNLGMAYGISGNLKRAKEIFEYGIAGDQAYPMYYYNLACAYAEMNDLDNAIVNLQTAFKYKQNMIKGERMPDPKTDSSFAKYMENKRFLKILETLNQ
jgi:tetratricopeptide (TPR) repeat protein